MIKAVFKTDRNICYIFNIVFMGLICVAKRGIGLPVRPRIAEFSR